MRYFVEMGGHQREVSVESRPDGSVAVEVGGRRIEVDVVTLGPREMNLRIGHQVIDLIVDGTLPDLGVVASGRKALARVESERMRAAGQAAGHGGVRKDREARSPMPGRVVKVLVRSGDAVVAGQAVAIVEAMKMENEVRASRGGVVAKVHAVQGSTIEANGVLVSFEP